MGQIVKRKKKGRPSKADLAKRNASDEATGASAPERDLRRSVRRRNVRYTFDFDDYLEEDDYEDEEDERGREKKLKLLMKLHGQEGGAESTPSKTQRVSHAPAVSASSSDYGDGNKPAKKRKIDDDDDTIDGDIDEDEDNDVDEDDEVRGRKAEPNGVDSAPGTPLDPQSRLPLPDKKSLELILDKLQKKDIYAVYAEPVDPEELPDYFDVIEHPMDFATVRNKLGTGKYSTLEQFESDIFLICSNAMQYNAPDTIYYKQARSIQELAQKKFQRLKISIERTEKELKSDEKTRSNSLTKRLLKKPVNRMVQEPVGSDFSSGATLATAGDFQTGGPVAVQASGCERPHILDGFVEGTTSLIDNSFDKSEELLPGRGFLSRFGRKPSMHDDNRRATYNPSIQPVAGSESILTTFEGESKQLVPVGVHADHSYARSLARFAAALGPGAWEVASRRIEQALPAGCKFGRGWVGEYEPLPTSVLLLENLSLKEPSLTKFGNTAGTRKSNPSSNVPVPDMAYMDHEHLKNEDHKVDRPTSEKKLPLIGTTAGVKPIASCSASIDHPVKVPDRVVSLERNSSFLNTSGFKPSASVNVNNTQQQNPQSKRCNEPIEGKVLKQVELNHPPSANQSTGHLVPERSISSASRSVETATMNSNSLQSASFKNPNVNGGALPNGKTSSNGFDSNRMISSCSDGFPNQMTRAATYFPQGQGQEQGLTDPVQLMRTLTEKAQNQQKSSNLSQFPSIKREDPGTPATASAPARAWMSMGAGGFNQATADNKNAPKNQISADSLYNPSRSHQPQHIRGNFPVPGMHFQTEKNTFPPHTFVSQPLRMGNETQFQYRPVVFPQYVTADLSRFQLQSQWHGLNPQTQTRQKQESRPPDLNKDCQSSGSPVRQSSSVLIDSQQPDLALQL